MQAQGGTQRLNLNILRKRVERIRWAHLIHSVLSSVDDHPIIQTLHDAASGRGACPWEQRVNETRQ